MKSSINPRVNAVLNSDAQSNNLCISGLHDDSLSLSYQKKIDLIRDHDLALWLICSLMFDFGLRVSEVLNIKLSDISSVGRLVVRSKKGSQPVVVLVKSYLPELLSIVPVRGFVFGMYNRFWVYRQMKLRGLIFDSAFSSKRSVCHSLRHVAVSGSRVVDDEGLAVVNFSRHVNSNNTSKYGKAKR